MKNQMKGAAGRRGDLKGKSPAHADENTAIDDAVASGVLSRSRGKALGPEGGASTSAVATEGVSTVRELDARYVEQLRKLDGCDVTKKGTIRKGRSCVILPGQINLAAAGGVIGSLEKLDTKKPLLYIDTPKVSSPVRLATASGRVGVAKRTPCDVSRELVLNSLIIVPTICS